MVHVFQSGVESEFQVAHKSILITVQTATLSLPWIFITFTGVGVSVFNKQEAPFIPSSVANERVYSFTFILTLQSILVLSLVSRHIVL